MANYGVRYSAADRARFMDLVCAGSSLYAAAAVVGASNASASRWWAQSGQMATRARFRGGGLAEPVVHELPEGRYLSGVERGVIQAGRVLGLSYAAIGAQIGRDKSVVYREVARNTGPDGVYRASAAHVRAHQRRRRPKPFLLVQNEDLCRRIEGWMDQGWSPKIIARALAEGWDAGQTGRVSHETIYQALYVQSRGQLRADLHQRLSLKRRRRVPAGRDRTASSPYREAFKISDRPAEVADRAVPGDWEGDLIMGPGNRSAIGTLVERHTRFTILLHLPGRHTADAVADAMIREMRHLPEHLRRSITWDRGTELADYKRIQLELNTTLYFCDPHSPWQRGTNENTNRLLRFWFEKGTDLSVHTAEDLRRAQDSLNARPRPTLDFQTPAQRLNQLLKTQQ